MYDAVDDIKKNNKVRSVILCSLVPGIFCAGKIVNDVIQEDKVEANASGISF